MASKAVYFISSDDDFIAANRAREIFEEVSCEIFDDMSKEIIDGASTKVDDALKACSNAIESAATMSMFGGKKLVWLKGVTFISENAMGKSEKVKKALDDLLSFCGNLQPDIATIVISASPVSRRSSFFKKISSIAEFEDYKSSDPISDCVDLISNKAKANKIDISTSAIQTLASIVAGNPRMAITELEKLYVYVNGERKISEQDVVDMVPIFGEGDFFDISNSFYSGDLTVALSALKRYFFANKKASARPIISTLQKQNSQLIQIRSLMEGGHFSKSTYPQSKGAFEVAADRFAEAFDGAQGKSAYNIFSQNSWYIGSKLAPIAGRMSLKKLIDIQMNLAKAFEDLMARPNSDEQVIRDMFVLSMSK